MPIKIDGLRPRESDSAPKIKVPSERPAKNNRMIRCRSLGWVAPNSVAMTPMAGSIESIDMATMAVSAATRAMNSAGRVFCILRGLVGCVGPET